MNPSQFKLSPEMENFVSSADYLKEQFNNMESSLSNSDFVTFKIYPDEFISESTSSSEDLLQIGYDLFNEINNFLNLNFNNYIWHKDSCLFKMIISNNKLNISLKKDINDIPIYYQGNFNYGDNIEDEWFVVYLLMKLSKEFPSISICINDADGEFLLVEAADYIPQWIGPDNSENRVWIRNNNIHIIPLDERGSNKHGGGINLFSALECMKRSPSSFIAEKKVQKCIQFRTTGVYPAKIHAMEHISTCIIPRRIAHILNSHPQLISVAVDSFCLSDKKNSNYMQSMTFFGKELNKDDIVTTPILFTRSLYAQLTFKPFHPPKKFHSLMNWVKIISNNQTTVNNKNIKKTAGEKNRLISKSFDIGCRIACGLEVAYQLSRNSINKSTITPDVDLFLNNLAKCDFYISTFLKISISEHYLMGKIILSSTLETLNNKENNKVTDSNIFMLTIDNILNQTINSYKFNENDIYNGHNDDWLYMTPDELDIEMENRINSFNNELSKPNKIDNTNYVLNNDISFESDDNIEDIEEFQDPNIDRSVTQLQQVVDSMKDFLKGKSGIDGVDTESIKKTYSVQNNINDNNSDDNSVDSDDNTVYSHDNSNRDSDDESDGSEINNNNSKTKYSNASDINFDSFLKFLHKEVDIGINGIKDKKMMNENPKIDKNDINLDLYFTKDDLIDSDDCSDDSDDDNSNDSEVKENIKSNNNLNDSNGSSIVDSDDENSVDSFYDSSNEIDSDDNLDEDEIAKIMQEKLIKHNKNGKKWGKSSFISEYQQVMNNQLLSESTLVDSFEYIDLKNELDTNNIEQKIGEIDVDKNLIKYLLESNATQIGIAGPASQLLSQMGVSLPSPPAIHDRKKK